MDRKNVVRDLSFEFALRIITLAEQMPDHRKYVLGNQLLKSGTSIGANVREAQQAESRQDFIHKMKIALKEADETEYWLLLCKNSPGYPDADDLLAKVISLKKLLIAIVVKAQNNSRNGI